jgi:hypothetical protein
MSEVKKEVSAVEWLIKEFSDILGPFPTSPLQDLLLHDSSVKAKKMFKQQIKDARLTAPPIKPNEKYSFKKEAQQYYNETYGKKNKQ